MRRSFCVRQVAKIAKNHKIICIYAKKCVPLHAEMFFEMKNTFTLCLLNRLSLLVTLFVLTCFCGCDIEYTETIGCDPQEKEIGLEGGSFMVDFRSYVKWTSSTNAEWLTVDPDAGKGDTILTITVAPTTVSRRGTITFDNGYATTTLSIRQYERAQVAGLNAD